MTLSAFGVLSPPPGAWLTVREEWRASGLPSEPAMVGVSSWEALWTDFAEAVTDPATQVAGETYQARVWNRLLPDADDPFAVGDTFRRSREDLVRPFAWVSAALAQWGSTCQLWCVTDGSSWLQRRKLRLAGLEPAFDEVLVSGGIGASKSDPRCHEVVRSHLTRLGSVPVAVVGDRADTDGSLASALAVPFVPVRPGTGPAPGAVAALRA